MLERRLELARAFALMLAGSLTLASPARSAPHVRVHAASSIDGHASRADGKVVFSGTLTDEKRQPLPGRTLSVTVSEGADHTQLPIEPCPRAAAGAVVFDRVRSSVGSLTTDSQGRFCVATTASAETSVAHFEWPGTALIDPATADVTSDPSRRLVELRLRCEPVVDLASESFVLRASARIVGDGLEAPGGGLALVLTNEAGTELAHATTSAAGEAHLTVSPARSLGAPGRGELRVDYAGDSYTASVRRAVEIERRVEVRLALDDAARGARPGRQEVETLAPGDPEDGVSIPVQVTTATGTPVSTGIVEASVDGRTAGAVAVEDGRAEVVATFAPEGPASVVQIRYAGGAPWFTPGPELTVRVPIATANPWRRIALLAACVAVLLWLALGRTKRPAVAPPLPSARKTATGAPRLDVIRSTSDPRVGWTGRIIDAHESVGLGDADVRVERPSFEGVEVLARTKTNDAGRFELRCDSAKRGDRLVVSSRLHAGLEQELPRFGEVEIALVLRRRALLDRFVGWARRRGGPFDSSLEPTPAHVARAATGDPGTVAWAEALERAGFGPGEVDAAAEDGVDRLAPKAARRRR